MKVDFRKELLSPKNEPLFIMEGKEKVPMTLGSVCYEALLTMLEGDKAETGKSKYERCELAGKVAKTDGAIELTVEEVAKIKERVGKTYGPIHVGPVFNLLEGE